MKDQQFYDNISTELPFSTSYLPVNVAYLMVAQIAKWQANSYLPNRESVTWVKRLRVNSRSSPNTILN